MEGGRRTQVEKGLICEAGEFGFFWKTWGAVGAEAAWNVGCTKLRYALSTKYTPDDEAVTGREGV